MTSPTPPAVPPRRRWFRRPQFGLSFLLLVVTLSAVVLSYYRAAYAKFGPEGAFCAAVGFTLPLTLLAKVIWDTARELRSKRP